MRLLVTGASGFVGRRVVADAIAAGFEVTAAVREVSRAHDVVASAARVVAVGDLGPDTGWRAALDGVDAVIHCAGRAHVVDGDTDAGEAAFMRVNHAATLSLAREARTTKQVRRFVFVSSLKVLGESSPRGRPWNGSEPLDPHDAYARSKAAAERDLAALHVAGDLEVATLRPPLTYGPHVEANFLRLWTAVARGRPLPLGAVRNQRSLVHVGNLASALLACATHPGAAGGRFVVDDGEAVSTAQLVREIAAALRRPARLLPVPPVAMRAAGALLGRGDAVRRLVEDLAVDSSRFRAATGWTPPCTRSEGLRETATWWQSSLHICSATVNL
jgi:nucleoside-diphosphate-sugar epimerase